MRYFFFLILIFSFYGCRKGPVTDDTINRSSNNQFTTFDDVDSLNVSNQELEIENVNIYLENSHSMGGYFRHPSSFYANLDEMVSDLILQNRFPEKVTTYTISDTIAKYDSVEEFRSDLDPTNETRIATANSSPLDKILANIYKNSGDQDISVLISDGIISGSNEQLIRYDKPKLGRYYNKDFVNNLKNDIKIELNYHIEKFGIYIYAFNSDFIATSENPYYKLDNSKVIAGTFTNRPYYFFVIGNPELLRTFEKKCRACRDAISTIEFGNSFFSKIAKLTNNYRGLTNCLVNGEKLRMENGQNDFHFAVLLDLKGFPSYYQFSTNLKDHLHLYLGDEKLEDSEIEIYSLKDQPVTDFNNRKNTIIELDQSTHVVKIKLLDFNAQSELPLSLKIENKIAPWYKEWSTNNDLNISYDNSKTFGFNFLIEGIAEAYDGFETPLFEYTIQRELK